MNVQARSAASAETGAVPGVSPQVYSDADFNQISKLVREHAGIVLAEGKKMLVYSRIAPLLRQSRHTTFREFLDSLSGNPAMTVQTVSALTTNHTYFHRESHHFDHFASHVRPSLIERAENGEAIRLWSSACSSGEEVWTMMMVLLGKDMNAGARLASRDIVTLATDLSGDILERAKAATYTEDAISALPDEIKSNWVTRSGDLHLIHDIPRQMVRFRQLNLLREWPFKTLFDVIFCRNVMIYFDQPTKNNLVHRLALQMHPGGILYVGHSERVMGPALDLLEPTGPTIYRRKNA